MEVLIEDKASIHFAQIVEWYYENRGELAALNFSITIEHIIYDLIPRHPNMGKEETILHNKKYEYRSFVSKHHKIIYHLETETISIIDIWDCRKLHQNQTEHPIEQIEQTENK